MFVLRRILGVDYAPSDLTLYTPVNVTVTVSGAATELCPAASYWGSQVRQQELQSCNNAHVGTQPVVEHVSQLNSCAGLLLPCLQTFTAVLPDKSRSYACCPFRLPASTRSWVLCPTPSMISAAPWVSPTTTRWSACVAWLGTHAPRSHPPGAAPHWSAKPHSARVGVNIERHCCHGTPVPGAQLLGLVLSFLVAMRRRHSKGFKPPFEWAGANLSA